MPSPSRNNAGGASPVTRQVLRNHRVGSTVMVASSGPWLRTVIRASTSVGDAFAYATSTAQYRSPSKTPVSNRFQFRFVPAAVMLDQPPIRVGGLRVVVPPPQPCLAGQRVEVPPVLLDVLAVVALRTGQPEHPLLQDRVDPVPQGQAQAQLMVDVRQSGHAVLVPPVRPGPGMIMRERLPRVAVAAVVLPDRAPRPFRQIRSPLVPRVRGEQIILGAAGGLRQPFVLSVCVHPHLSVDWNPTNGLCRRASPPPPSRSESGGGACGSGIKVSPNSPGRIPRPAGFLGDGPVCRPI